MERKRSQNEKLDAIGKTLVETSRLSDAELDKIVSAPHLFKNVQAAIVRDRQVTSVVKEKPHGTIFTWRLASAGSLVAAMLLASAVGITYFLRNTDRPQTAGLEQRREEKRIEPIVGGGNDVATLPFEKAAEFKPARIVFNNSPARQEARKPIAHTRFKKLLRGKYRRPFIS